MAFKKKNKKTVAHKKIVMARRIKENRQLFSTRMCATEIFVNGGSSAGSLAGAAFISFPNYVRNGSGSIIQCNNVSNNWSKFLVLFDQYRVRGLAVEFIPFINVAASDVVGEIPYYYQVMDVDDSINITSEAMALDTPGVKTLSSFKRTKTFYRNPNKKDWINTSNALPATANTLGTAPYQFMGSLQPINPYGSIKTYFPGVAATTTIGIFKYTWYITFRGIQSTN